MAFNYRVPGSSPGGYIFSQNFVLNGRLSQSVIFFDFCDNIWPMCKNQMHFDLKLSSKGIANIPVELYDDNFEFIISGVIHKCTLITAEFLSPKICALRRADPSISEYTFEAADPLNKFGEFLSLPSESHLGVSSETFDFFVSVSRELENSELLSQLVSGYFAANEINTSNAVSHLQMKQYHFESDEEEVRFIATRFSEIKGLGNLDVHLLRRVLSHPSLRIESEDFLYNFIVERIREDESYAELLDCVIFKFLSYKSIKHFIDWSQSFIFDHLNSPLWNALCERLLYTPILDTESIEQQDSRFGRVLNDAVREDVHVPTDQTDADFAKSTRAYHRIFPMFCGPATTLYLVHA